LKSLFWHLLQTFGIKAAKTELRRQSLLVYLRFLRGLRKSIVGVLLLSVLFQLMVLGLVGTLVAVVALWPGLELELRLEIFAGVSLVLFLAPLFCFGILLSDRAWYRASGAANLIEQKT